MNKQTDIEYSKNDARMISGIALCMMLVHHFWGFPNWLNEGNICKGIFFFDELPLKDILAGGCQLCIPIFAFNTGYVLFKRSRDFTFRKNLKRIARFLISYWIVCLLFILIGYLTKNNLPNLPNLFLNLIGLKCGTSGYISVPFAWYVNFYISFVLVSPLIIHCIGNKNILKDFLFLSIWILFLGISISNFYFNGSEVLRPTTIYLFSVGLTSIVAFCTAKYDLFSKLDFNVPHKAIICLAFIFLIIIFRYFLSLYCLRNFGHSFGYFQDCIYTPLIIFSALTVLHSLRRNSRLKTILHSIGTYSMNMWFIHGIFFVGIHELQWLLYLPQYSILVLIWGFLLTYPIAIWMTKLQSYILKFFKL